MTDPRIIDDTTSAPPMLDREVERGWYVGQIDGTYVITFLDGRPPIVGQSESIEFFTNNSKEHNMPDSTGNYADEAVEEATGILQRYLDPALTFIGQYLTSASEVMRVKRPWNDLARSEVLGRVTLDTEPEVRGRPQPGRPGIEQIVFMALPPWHAAFKPGVQEVAALLYRPVTTYLAEQIDNGRVVKVERASSYDVTGWIGIVNWFGSLEEAEQERQDLWQAVKDSTSGTEGIRDDFEEDADPLAGRYGSAAAWGL